jgi:hypothetical protein
MAKKEGKPIFLKAFSLVLAVLFLNLAGFVFMSGGIAKGLTGFSIKDTVYKNYFGMSFGVKIYFIAQWSLLLIILFYAFFRDVRVKKLKTEVINFHINKNLDKNKTDLDTLYEILKEKKELTISSISKSFNVTKDIAMEWCKILETGELVSIDYPSFSEPVIRIVEKEVKNIIPEKDQMLKESLEIKKGIEKPYTKKSFKPKIKKIKSLKK